MKRCILHLGMPKTASTSIQRTLTDNRTYLQKHGWEYPVFRCPEHGHEFFPQNDPLCRIFMPMQDFHARRPALNGEINLEIQERELRKALLEYTQKSDRIILSSEALIRPKPLRKIKKFFQDLDFVVEPVIYVRSPYSYRVSMYQSVLRSSQMQSSAITQTLQKPIIKNILSSNLSVFGENIKVYSFNNLIRKNTEIVTHFLGSFLEKDIVDKLHISRENESLSRHAIALLEYIEEKLPLYQKHIKSNNRTEGDIQPIYKIKGEKFGFDPEKAGMFKEVIDLENNWLREQFGPEYCDSDYSESIYTSPLKWEKENIASLLEVFPCLGTKIQPLVLHYILHNSQFPSEQMRLKTVKSMKIKIYKKRLRSLLVEVKSCYPRGKRIINDILGAFR